MSDKDLQRLTELVSYIGQAVVQRLVLLPRHHHATPKVKIAGKRTLHLSVHEDGRPAEIFLRMEGLDYSSELIGLYGVIARLISLTLQYGRRLRRWGNSSQASNLNGVAPSPDLMASSILRVCRI